MRGRRPAAGLVSLLALAATLPACSESTLSIGYDLHLDLISNSPVAAGDSVVFEYDAAGISLSGMVVDFGDSSVDSLSFHGAQTAAGRIAHRYGASGDYPVSATVTDAVQGSRTRSLSVTVNP